eukprot:scaffold1824_cov83-Phaeocystis_antarctica.AAC.2
MECRSRAVPHTRVRVYRPPACRKYLRRGAACPVRALARAYHMHRVLRHLDPWVPPVWGAR